MPYLQSEPAPLRTPRGLLAVMLLLALAVALHYAQTGADPLASSPRDSSLRTANDGGLPLGRASDGHVAMSDDRFLTDEPDSRKGPTSPHKPGRKRPDPIPVYGPYLKDPKTLGFEPDALLFETVYQQVKNQHVDLDPDEKLFQGVVQEVRGLLKEARVNGDALTRMRKDRALPEEVIRIYGRKVDRQLLWYAMTRGLLEGTRDPYSVLMTPKEYDTLMEQMQNHSFGGIGIYIELDHDKKDQLTVVEPLEGTPAYKAGIQAGDQIIKINGRSSEGMSLDQATTLIRGEIGTRVILTIRRGTESRDYAIARAPIEVASVSHKLLADNVGYVRLRLFGSKTGKELDEALDALEKGGARALIVDLRNNGGGFINAAVDVCSHFIPPGELVTYVTKKHGERSDYNGDARERSKLPVVLLVNQYSASASEITAGCFKDYGVATLVGVKTFGKGSVQQLYPLPSGAALKLTIAHFFTPKGSRINKVGVEPHIKVEMEARLVGRGDKDVQLQKAVDYFKSKDII